jgi:hypothetical protein
VPEPGPVEVPEPRPEDVSTEEALSDNGSEPENQSKSVESQ